MPSNHPNVFPINLHRQAGTQKRWTEPQSYADPIETLRQRLNRRRPFGERLVEWVQRSAVEIGLAFYTLAVLIACYFAFQLGRGVHL